MQSPRSAAAVSLPLLQRSGLSASHPDPAASLETADGLSWVIGHYVLLEGQLFGFLVPESRYFSWLGPTMRMDRSCCWKGDFSALLRGKVTILVGRVCLVPGVIGHCVLLEGGGLPRSPSAPRALLGASARSSAKPSHNTCGLPPTNTFRPITLVLSHHTQ